SLSFIFFCIVLVSSDISPLSLHDALPIYRLGPGSREHLLRGGSRVSATLVCRTAEASSRAPEPTGDRCKRSAGAVLDRLLVARRDRKSTRLNSSHVSISYAVFCLKKKKQQ